jgi:hypothetical protein
MLTSLKNRLEALESQQPQQRIEPLKERIDKYLSIMDSGDYSSDEGKRLKVTMDKYWSVLENANK